ncbi:MAG: hypothetical protein KDB88_13045 [Flavobacteriales bacterium]|nr:hypothetical protein [Flavobacteriales bacterium]
MRATIALAVAVLVYVTIRAAWMPTVHDEARTFQQYVQTGEFLPFASHWDAGNHLLVTTWGNLVAPFFGPDRLALRAISLVGALLYLAYAALLTRRLMDPFVRTCTAAALMACPFLIDFFSLFRGYGISLGFFLMALYHIGSLQRGTRERDLALALLACVGMVWANLNLLLIAGPMLAIMLHASRSAIPKWRMLRVLIPTAAALLFFGTYALELRERGTLYYGLETGFVRGTLASLLTAMFGGEAPWAWVPAASLVVFIALAWVFGRDGTPRTALLAALSILLGFEMVSRTVLHHAFGTPFPEDRTALHLVPLMLLAFGSSLDLLKEKWHMLRWVALFLLALPLRTVLTANVGTTSFWPEQAIPAEVIQHVAELQAAHNRPLVIGAYHQMAAVWSFEQWEHDLLLNPLRPYNHPDPHVELLLLDPLHDRPPEGFVKELDAGTGRLELWHHAAAIQVDSLVWDSAFHVALGEREFTEVWHPQRTPGPGGSHLLEVELLIDAPHPLNELQLVSEWRDVDGDETFSERIPLQVMALDIRGRKLHLARLWPAYSERITRRVLYLWSPRSEALQAAVRLKVVALR